jgi:hypothetical protein
MLAFASFSRCLAVTGLGAAAGAFGQEYTVVDLAADLPVGPSQQPIYPTSSSAGLNELGRSSSTLDRTPAPVWPPCGTPAWSRSSPRSTSSPPAWTRWATRAGSAPEVIGLVRRLERPGMRARADLVHLDAVLLLDVAGARHGRGRAVHRRPQPAGIPGSGVPYSPQVEAYIASAVPGGLQVTRLGLVNGLSTVGWAINATVTSSHRGSRDERLPVLFRQGQAYTLPILRLAANRATGLNRANQVVGYVSDVTPSPGFNACEGAVWDVTDPNMPNLLTIGQWGSSNRTSLQDIDDSGVAVGFAAENQVSVELWRRAIRWDATRGIVALDTLLGPGSQWVLSDAVAINEAGQIAATGRWNGSLPRAVRLDPVTPPGASGGSGGPGGVGLDVFRRPRR